jgi:fatty acid desaturase
MHKQHHTFTNNIDKDPELTSFFTREQLENPGFRNLPCGRVAYFRSFLDPLTTILHRAGRIAFSTVGVAVDYSGWGWSMGDWKYSDSSNIMRGIQLTAISQVIFYVSMVYVSLQDRALTNKLLFWWVIPVFVGYPCVNYVRNLEHADCEVSKEPNCLRNTRTLGSNLLTRTLLWDTNYHAEHHCYPMVPFFNLHKVHALMKDHVIHSECHHFTTQNWEAVKPNGWIDQQAERCMAYERMVKCE